MIIKDTTTNVLAPPIIPHQVIRKTVPKPPVPALKAESQPSSSKKERRMELQGLEPGDPRNTISLIKRGVRNAAAILPPLIKKYGWIVPVVLLVWSILGSFNAMKLAMANPTLAPLWLFLEKIVLFLVFLTGAYNNFIAKAVYGTVVIRVVLPLIRRCRREGFSKVSKEFTTLIPNLKHNWALVGMRSIGLIIFFAGLAAFISNFLTRNNAVDKIAVSLAIAFAMIKALSDGARSIPFMTGRVVANDIFVALRKPSPVRNHHIYLAISGLAAGFFSSIVLSVLRNPLGENIGYILGGIAMLAGAACFILLRSKKANA